MTAKVFSVPGKRMRMAVDIFSVFGMQVTMAEIFLNPVKRRMVVEVFWYFGTLVAVDDDDD